MAVERVWNVFHEEGKPACRVWASSAVNASMIAKHRLRKRKIEVFPHREDCDCKTITNRCEKAHFESQLQGTPLGKLCNL